MAIAGLIAPPEPVAPVAARTDLPRVFTPWPPAERVNVRVRSPRAKIQPHAKMQVSTIGEASLIIGYISRLPDCLAGGYFVTLVYKDRAHVHVLGVEGAFISLMFKND